MDRGGVTERIETVTILPLPVRLHVLPGGKAPAYQTEGSVGADVFAHLDAPMVIYPYGRRIVPLGFIVEIPIGWEMQVRPRSGLANRDGITVLNSPGTIDVDYRQEVGAILINHGTDDFEIKPGDRIAQVVIAPVRRAMWTLVDAAADLTATDRKGGYGSTGQ